MGLSTAFALCALRLPTQFLRAAGDLALIYEATNAAAMRVMPREWISDPASAVAKAEAQ